MPADFSSAILSRRPNLVRRLARWFGLALLAGWLGFAAIVLVLRYQVLPNIDRYRPDLEQMASQSLGLGVSIGGLKAGWDGLHPDLVLEDVRLANRQGESVLAFSKVEAVLSWRTLAVFEPRLHRLVLNAPVLHVQREADGRLLVAGMPIEDDPQSDASLVDWVLRQREIVIRDALLIWEDARRGAPPLFLENLQLRLDNDGSRHRFGLTGRPPAGLAGRLDLRGDLRGTDVGKAAEWHGEVFAETEAVDLAGWRTWFDYPVDLPQGRGNLRLWLGIERGLPAAVTVDLALQDARVRVTPKLPALDIEVLHGRLQGRRQDEGFVVSGRGVALQTRDGIALPATDFEVGWKPEADGFIRGRATASALDLEVMRRLAASLPFDARTRELLADFAPRGRILDLKANWHGNAERAQAYSVKAGFEGLGANARGVFPGFSGLTGTIDADEDEGRVVLRSGPAGLELPAVFPAPSIAFDALAASVRWKIRDGALEAELLEAEFSGPDALGSAHGRYERRLVDGGAGSIDLSARLEQADGRAVWRYMPHVVSEEARVWLKRGILAGKASDVQLTLQGDLDRFPFRNPADGKFLVVAKAADVVVDYADDWPRIEAIHGKLRFEGARMLVDADAGQILGTRVSATRVEIPDMEVEDTELRVNGLVDGPTPEFLRFIALSPVGEMIGNVTEDMKASGNGRLNLALSIPLSYVEKTQVKGDYQFLANEVVVDPALPPVSQLNGRLSFTGDEVSARELGGSFLGAPLKVSVRTEGERVVVNAQGSASAPQLRRLYDWPGFDHLSGTAPWRAEIRGRRKEAEIVVESNLLGISSSLPAPLNKSASDPLALRVEKATLPVDPARSGAAPRDQWKINLGKSVAAQAVRRLGGAAPVIEAGALAVGEPLQLPERGLALQITQPRLDLDAWRALLPKAAAGGEGKAVQPLPAVALKVRQLQLFGRDWHDVNLRSLATPEGLVGRLDARDASGDWAWSQAGKGRLQARLKHFSLPAENAPARTSVAEALDSLPALDVVAEQFSLGKRPLGRLELDATNEARAWHINRLSLISPDGTLSGTGRWRFGNGDRTQIAFQLDAHDAGRLLARFGHPDAIRRGTARLEGRLGWYGVPTAIDYGSLTGEIRLAAEKGQFAQLEPGIGKLFSLLSLQMLPRRISLDFRDVFSEGFAFDAIGGRMTVANGIMSTEDLNVVGPAAKVLMRGEVDLARETQNLRVAIQPELGGTVALGAAVVNPIAGLATLLAQKIFQDPINKAFAFEYAVTGSWADPKVEKVSRPLQPQEVP